MTPADIVVLIAALLAVILAAAVPILRKRKGKTECGSGCVNCPHAGRCVHSRDDDAEA